MSGFHILCVSSSSSPEAGAAGTHAAAVVDQAGHTAIGPQSVPAQRGAIQAAIAAAAASSACDIVLVVGGVGLRPDDASPEALASITTTPIPGFADIFRLETYREAGSAAPLSRACGAVVGPALAFAIPATDGAVDIALDGLILPQLEDYLGAIDTGASVPTPSLAASPATDDEIEEAEVEEVDAEDAPPPPQPRWRLGSQSAVSMEAEPIVAEAPEGDDALPNRGWKRAVYDLEGEIQRGASPDVPHNLERHAPIMDVLYQAGEYARMKLPNGNRVMLYGYPDLQRANSKVLMVGWGEPLAEVVALHRYPTQAGTCIDEARGIMPGRGADIAAIAEAVTGRPPPDASGALFAVDHDTIYIERGGRVSSWDGRRMRQEGTPKQALTSMVVRWHGR